MRRLRLEEGAELAAVVALVARIDEQLAAQAVEGHATSVRLAMDDPRPAEAQREEVLVPVGAVRSPTGAPEDVSGPVHRNGVGGHRTLRTLGRGVFGDRSRDGHRLAQPCVADGLVGAVRTCCVGEEAGHLGDAREVCVDRLTAATQLVPRHPIALPVVQLVADRTLVGDTLRVNALGQQHVDAAGCQRHPIVAALPAADLQQADVLVERMVAVADVEVRVGERLPVKRQGLIEPALLLRQDLRDAGQHDRSQRRRVVVPAVRRWRVVLRVEEDPGVSKLERPVEVGNAPRALPRLRERQQPPQRMELELPVGVVERVLRPGQMDRQLGRGKGRKLVAVGHELVGHAGGRVLVAGDIR